MSTDSQMRDAVVKLETKMEVMSDSMVSMAASVAKLADLRYELVAVKKDIDLLELRNNKNEKIIEEMVKMQSAMQTTQNNNSYVIGKVQLFWTAIVTGAISFAWWKLRN
jgi:hypothetical protein